VLEAVTEAMVGSMSATTAASRAPAHLMMGEDLLACMLGDVYTDIEKTMIALQRQALVNERAASFNRRWSTASSPRSSG
jgi:hypothetical protein